MQSFILGAPSPYENEPGQSALGHTPAAEQYNKAVQNKVVECAMIPWIARTSRHSPLWKKIVEKYWDSNGDEVLSRVKEATASNPLMMLNAKALGNALYHNGPGNLKRKRGADSTISNSQEHPIQRWVYTGELTMKEIRRACHEIGAQPGKSKKESLERLEQMINEFELADTEQAKKWGKKVSETA